MTEVYAADLGSNPFIVNKRTAGGFLARNLLAVFNTPASSWDTIVMPKLIGGYVGDIVKLSVYKGSIPNDLATTDDDTEDTRKLDIDDFLGSATYTVTGSDTPAEGIVAQFDFSTTFSVTNCGATYTVLMQQFDSSGNDVAPSQVFCTDRDGVYNFINDVDWGYEGDGTSTSTSQGGAGNSYTMFLPPSGFTIYDGIVATAPFGASQRDPCPAWGIYSREVVTLNSTAYGTTRSLTAPLTNSLTEGLTQ